MRRRKWFGGVLLVLSGMLGALFFSTSATAAVQPPVTVTITSTQADRSDIMGPGMRVSGTFNDPANPGTRAVFDNHFAGLIKITIPGVSGTTYAFCIEISVPLLQSGETTATLDEQDWSAAGPLKNALPNITFILNKYAAGATTDNTEAAAIQSAIWHFSDGFTLASNSPGALLTRTQTIIDDATTNGAVEPPAPKLAVTPDTATATAGQQAGPYTVQLVGASTAAVVASAGSTVRDCTTHAAVTSVANGGTVCLFRPDEGAATLTVSAQGLLPSGRIFIDQSFNRQMIILANGKNVPLQVSAAATFTPTASTTTTTTTTTSSTTSTSTTSTTVAPTSTTVAPTSTSTTSTTVAVLPLQITPTTPAPASTATAPATLPLTGRRSVSTLLLAVTCLLIGAILLFLSRPEPSLAIAGGGATASRPQWRDEFRRQLPWWLRRSRRREL